MLNPGKLGTRQRVRDLLSLLETKQCMWVKLTSLELEEHIAANKRREEAGEEVYKRRKKASTSTKAARSAAVGVEFILDDAHD